jgi:hypothetical protein
MVDVIREYFDNSNKQTILMFIDEQNLSKEELDVELINLIKSKKAEL